MTLNRALVLCTFCAILDQRVLVILLEDDVVLPSLLMRLSVGVVVVMAVAVTVTVAMTVMAVVTVVGGRSGRGAVVRKVLVRGEDRRPCHEAAVES